MKNKFLTPFSILVLVFLYFPILILMMYSFNDSKVNAEWKGFTFDWYINLFQNDAVRTALINSLIIAIVTTIVATLLGTLAAIALSKYKYRLKGVYDGIVYLPILIPDILMGISLVILFSQLGINLSIYTVIAAHVTFCISFVVVIVSSRLSGYGKEIEEAANDLGATPWQTFRFITLPNILPGVIAAALLTFTLSIDDFVISSFVSGPESTTLPIYIYGLVKRGISPEINALSTILIVTIVVLMLLSEKMGSKGDNGSNGSSRLPF